MILPPYNRIKIKNFQNLFEQIVLFFMCRYGLLGASGCGKTTLLSCIVGRRKLNSGQIHVLGGKPGTKGNWHWTLIILFNYSFLPPPPFRTHIWNRLRRFFAPLYAVSHLNYIFSRFLVLCTAFIVIDIIVVVAIIFCTYDEITSTNLSLNFLFFFEHIPCCICHILIWACYS